MPCCSESESKCPCPVFRYLTLAVILAALIWAGIALTGAKKSPPPEPDCDPAIEVCE